MKDELAALLPRLEGGEASRELDALLEVMARNVEAERTGLAPEHWAKWCASPAGLVGDRHTTYAADRFTASLDAALALAERVLPEHRMLELFECDDGGNWGAHWRKPETETAFAPKPALALCAAIVKAKIGEVG